MSETDDNKMMVEEETDDSSSNDDEDEQEKLILSRAEELERNLAVNKYDYDAHVELVGLYRKLTDFKSMREAYQRFHECFPLTPKLWLEWIKDEISVASPSQHEDVFKLFDQAVEDYLSVDLWIEYAQYSIGVSDLSKTRSIIERGLTSAGLHVTEASLLWDTLREIEFAHLSLAEKDSDEWKAQVTRVFNVFRRQLSVPLIGMENTYKEWSDWFNTLPADTVEEKPVEWGYKKALKSLDAYKPFEEKLLGAQDDVEVLQVYRDYIKVVTDPSTVICLYERAAFKLCLTPDIWLDYCMFYLKFGEDSLKVCNRALRNCTWSEDLWVMKVRILEHLNRESNEVMSCFEQGISNVSPPGLELWLTYLEYSYRHNESKEQLDKLFDQARHQFNFNTDPTSKITKYFAMILSKRGDHAVARKMWKAILQKTENKGSASIWLEYINFEKQYGDNSEVRSLFQRALSSVTDWPQYIAENWLLYERVYGDLQGVLNCAEKCRTTLSNVPQYTAAAATDQHATKNDDNQGRKRRQTGNVTVVEEKRRKIHNDKPIQPPTFLKKQPVERDPTKTVFISNIHPSVTEEQIKQIFPNSVNLEIVLDKKGKSRCFGYVQFSMEEEVMTALARDREPLDGRPIFISNCKPDKNERKPLFKYANTQEENKLFVRGLPVNKTQEDVETIFKPYGAVAVRLVLHKSGQPKGLAYVEFENKAAAEKAMKTTDQMTVDEHVITVAISAPPPPKKSVGPAKRSEPIRHARSNLEMPLMVPRSLQVKTADTSNGTKPKSNADFRSMFLKK